jgi:hypothetical protein
LILVLVAPLLAADPTDDQLKSAAWWLAQAEQHARSIEVNEQKAEVLASIAAGYAEVGDKIGFKRMVLQSMLNGSGAWGAQKGIIMAGLAEAYASAGELDQAQRMEEYMEEAIDRQQVRERIAATLARRQDAGWPKAVDRAVENIKKLPKSEHEQVHAYMAMISAGAGDFDKAEALLAKVNDPALRVEARGATMEAKVRNAIAGAAEAVKSLVVLEAELTKAQAKDADLAWAALASAYVEAGQLELAKRALPKIKDHSMLTATWCRIADGHHKLGEADAAGQALAEAEAQLKKFTGDDLGDVEILKAWAVENIARTRMSLGAGKAVWEWASGIDTQAGKALACRGAAEALLSKERAKKSR